MPYGNRRSLGGAHPQGGPAFLAHSDLGSSCHFVLACDLCVLTGEKSGWAQGMELTRAADPGHCLLYTNEAADD